MSEVDQDEGLSAEVQAYQAKEVQQFLKHRGLEVAFQRTKDRITRQWEAAQDPLSREMAWHKLAAFKELQTELRAFGDRRPTLTVES